MSTIALFGAGGKMGCRIADNLVRTEHRTLFVEVAPGGIENLKKRGLSTTPKDEALAAADVVVLAVPDNVIGQVAPEIVPQMRAGAMLICLDAAAPYAGELPARKDVSYVVTHPCHPPIFNDETDPEARRDYFGGVKAKQNIVVALMQGPEADYAKGEAVCRAMFAPVMRSHRVTVEQMILLEPALSETSAATCVTMIREAMEESIRRGVPREAARDFLLGHLNIELAIVFEEVKTPFSDGAKKAIEKARGQIFKEDWKRVFDEANVRDCVAMITGKAPGREPSPSGSARGQT